MVAVSQEGIIFFFDNIFGQRTEEAENAGIKNVAGPDFPKVELNFPLTQRTTMKLENEDADELVENK